MDLGNILVLAEKPSVGKDIAKALGATSSKEGYMEGKGYVVTWGMGHLVTLADPEDYDKKYQTWRMEDLPILPERMKLTVIGQSARQYKTVKFLMDRKDVDSIVIATDAGREGELVARWIIKVAGVRKPMKRLWISSATEKAVREGFTKLRDSREYDNLYRSAEARSHADWIVGINATRALTVKHNAQLSLGRVQTPTLAIIRKREEEINSFRSVDFYEVGIEAKGASFAMEGGRIFDREKAEAIREKLVRATLKVDDVTVSEKKSEPPLPYDLTELQRDCNSLYGFSPKETLNLMQTLYERHKVLTYPRTDSRYLTKDLVATLPDRIRASAKGQLSIIGQDLIRKGFLGKLRCVDDSKVGDHHAIIPTEDEVRTGALTDKEKKVYDLVVSRFIAALSAPYVYREVSIKASAGGEKFSIKARTTVSLGYRAVPGHKGDEKDDLKLHEFKKGDTFPVEKAHVRTGKTTPPEPFNEGTLLTAMENPLKYMEGGDKEQREALSSSSGLGTVATRADIIEKLFSSFVIEKRGKGIYTTSKGRQLLTLAPQDLKSPALTADWEHRLSLIKEGKLAQDKFIGDMEEYARKVVREIKASQGTFRHDNLTGSKCPDCGKALLEVKGKNSVMHVCQDRECGFRKTISTVTNARCPECHKKMELIGEGDNKQFRCICGHREKLSAFNARREKEGTAMSKRDVGKFLKDMEKESEPLNSALADKLKDLFK